MRPQYIVDIVKMVSKWAYYVIAAGSVLALILGGIICYQINYQDLKVIFFNVGQGDAILISEGSHQVLIDGGRNGKVMLEKLGKFVPFWDRNIEAVIATHPDQDHIGGLVEVLAKYKVDFILETNAKSDSATYKAFEENIAKSGAEKIEAKKGIALKFPDGTTLAILHPFFEVPEASEYNSNDNSIVARLELSNDSFLFTGDLLEKEELALIGSKQNLSSNVLKVAHHGSKYSTSAEFLDAVKPAEAIISVGNNSYGHPAQEVITRLSEHGVKIYRTDEIGDIIYECNPPPGGQNEKCKIGFK